MITSVVMSWHAVNKLIPIQRCKMLSFLQQTNICHVLKCIPANTKHLYNICTMLDQRRRRWADVVQMLYKCFVFAGENRLYTMYP